MSSRAAPEGPRIAGSAEAMREHVLAGGCATTSWTPPGRGGVGTLNISTAAALVAAGAGAAKRRPFAHVAPSRLRGRARGARLHAGASAIEDSIEPAGVRLPLAPTRPPSAMRHAAPVRRQLAARTVFNVLGPLANPAARGAYSPDLVPTIADVSARLGARRALRRCTAASTSSPPPGRTWSTRGVADGGAPARGCSTRSTSAFPAAIPTTSSAAAHPECGADPRDLQGAPGPKVRGRC